MDGDLIILPCRKIVELRVIEKNISYRGRCGQLMKTLGGGEIKKGYWSTWPILIADFRLTI